MNISHSSSLTSILKEELEHFSCVGTFSNFYIVQFLLFFYSRPHSPPPPTSLPPDTHNKKKHYCQSKIKTRPKLING